MLTTFVLLLAASPDPPDTVVVCPRDFVAALAPWLHHRESQGHRVEIIPNTKPPQELRDAIRGIARAGKLRYVLLIGDADPRADSDPALARRCTPTFRTPAKVNVRWGSEPEIGADNPYSDLDDDQLPDLAIGRLTADSPGELSAMVRKIIDYEHSSDYGPWRRQINFVAGVGGFSALADFILEAAARRFLTEGIPAAYQTTMTYGSWRSPYCPDPRRFHDAAVERFNEGCLFWVYLGHGQRTFLDRISVPGRAYHILDVGDMGKLNPGGRPPITVLLSCYAGAFDDPEDCLGEELLRVPHGAVAVIGGSRVTMPYAMAVLGHELMDGYFGSQAPTLGDVLLSTKRKMATAPGESGGASNRNLLDALAMAVSPHPELLDEERREHLLLFNLLGDPLLRLPRPLPVRIDVPSHVHAGDRLRVGFTTDVAGDVTVELVCRRDRFKETPPPREYFDGRDRILASYNDAYRKANDSSWCEQNVRCSAGPGEVWLDIPIEARGNCHVRTFVRGSTQYAMGSADVFIRRPRVDELSGN